eukprot:scaffold3422_cov87-Skeletonema_dohrnii-CCMP3373.AAC.2
MTKQGSKATRIHFITTFCSSELVAQRFKRTTGRLQNGVAAAATDHLLYPLHGSHFASGS